MTQDRLSNLSILSIENVFNVYYKQVIYMYLFFIWIL